MNKINEFAKKYCEQFSKASFLDSNMILWKWINGEWIGKPAIKDKNYKGHRYIWEDEI